MSEPYWCRQAPNHDGINPYSASVRKVAKPHYGESGLRIRISLAS